MHGVYVDDYWKQFDNAHVGPLWNYVAISAYSLMAIFGLPSNSFVIFYYIKRLKHRKSYSYLMINLMIADLLLIFTNLPLVIYNSYYGEWMFSQIICDIYAICGALFGFVSILTMTLISIERYLVIKYPFKVLESNKTIAIVLIVASWVYALMWCILPILTPHKYVPEGFRTSCTFDFISRDANSYAIIISMNIFGFFVPICVTSLFYALLLLQIKNHYASLKSNFNYDFSVMDNVMTSNVTAGASTFHNKSQSTVLRRSSRKSELLELKNINIATTPNKDKVLLNIRNLSETTLNLTKKKKLFNLSSELRITRSSIFIVLMFVCSWFPYAIVSLLSQYAENRHRYVTPTTAFLTTVCAKSSSMLNPIVYAFTNKEFSVKFKKFLRKYI